jgi:predicted nucleic acid-binding protein
VTQAAGANRISRLNDLATRTPVTVVVAGIATHPEDDLVLAAAVSAGADYLVTGDKQLLRIGRYEGVTIVSPRDFLTLLDKQEDEAAAHS